MLGLPATHVVLQAYQPEWPQRFAEEAARIGAVLGDWTLAIEHIGSTSVPGLAAKPVIDIGVAVRNFEEATRCIAPLTALGYAYLGEWGLPRRHYFVKEQDEQRTHNLHMLEPENPDWRQQLAFRNYLRQRPAVAEEYAAVKQACAVRYPADRLLYTRAKAGFITKVLRIAAPELWPQPGAIVTVKALRGDNTVYRSWTNQVESVGDETIVTYSLPNKPVTDVNQGVYTLPNAIRTTYWYDRPYNLLEVIAADGRVVELYMNVASPVSVKGHELLYTDHELDVIQRAGEAARIVDQDEFAEAIVRYGYSPTFQAYCYQAAQEALAVIKGWPVNL